jgi:cell division septation protein DedD
MARILAPHRSGWRAGVAALGLAALAAATPAAAHPALRATRTADDLPVPPTPAPPPGCSKDEQAAKAARLVVLLQSLIQSDPTRARQLLNLFQTTVQRAEQHQIDPGQACRAYDGLIAQAGG